MAKVLVLYYSAYGHIEPMANAAAEGAREAGVAVDMKRVPELVPPEVAKASSFKLDQPAPVAKNEEWPTTTPSSSALDALRPHVFADGEFLGSGRPALDEGRAAWQGRRRFRLDRNPARRPRDDAVLEHHQPAAFRHDRGWRLFGFQGQMTLDEMIGGSPYGATTIAGGEGSVSRRK